MSNKTLVEEVTDLVEANGGWLNVIARMTSTFDEALAKVGNSVDCPFPDRHRNSGGQDDFRFSEKAGFEGRAICSCFQARGIAPIDLLLMDGIGGGDFVKAMREVKKALSPTSGTESYVKRAAPVVVRRSSAQTPERLAYRKKKLTTIAKGLVELSHPTALPGREYFRKRGIAVTSAISDVKFHPSLEYYEKKGRGASAEKVLVGLFPAIVSAFRDELGRVVNLHKIYITAQGDKLGGVSKVKKIDSPLNGFKGSSICVADVKGCRTLHVTEGVEKAWAIHLATGESVKAAYSCTLLLPLFVDLNKYDRVVVWSDRDPARPNSGRDHGDGQFFAWELFKRLRCAGVAVGFMLPIEEVLPEGQIKGRDWEDIIVQEALLDLNHAQCMNELRQRAVRQGVFHGFEGVMPAIAV